MEGEGLNKMTKKQRIAGRRVPLVLLGGLGASTLSMAIFAHLAEEILENEALGLDQTGIAWARAHRSPVLDRLLSAVTASGEPWAQAIESALVGGRWTTEHRTADTVTLAFALGGGGLINQMLKRFFRRPRPAQELRRAHATGYSFPSGHAMTSLAFSGTFAYLVSRRGGLTGHPAARLVWVPVVLWSLLMGISRVYLEVHYPTDVLSSWAVATIWITTCGIARNFMEPEES